MTFSLEETGQGPAILFLPGSYSTAAAWRGVWNNLSAEYRLIATSLPGYGSTSETRSDQTHDMTEMVDFVEAAVIRVGEPVHLVGHSFGGLAIIAALHARQIAPLSLITFEANPVACHPPKGEYSWRDDAKRVFHDLKNAHESGDQNAAGVIIDYWSKAGTFAALPASVKEYCRQTVRSNILDWQSGFGFTPRIIDFSGHALPTTIVRGEFANQAIVDLSSDLAVDLSGGEVDVVKDADHFLISTHPKACAEIIDRHMSQTLS